MEDKNLPDKETSLTLAGRVNKRLTALWHKRYPSILAGTSLIPRIGGSLTTYIALKRQQMSEKRTEELVNRVNEIDKQALTVNFFNDEAGYDLFVQAIEASAKTRSEEKRDLIARILVGATRTDPEQEEYSAEEYLNLIEDLNEKELYIARTIYTGQREIQSPKELEPNNKAETWRLTQEALTRKHGIEADALPLYLNRLHLAGLLDLEYVVAGFDAHGFAVQEEAVPTYWVSSAFRSLMEFLNLNDSDPK